MKALVRRMPRSVLVCCCQLLLAGSLLGVGPAIAHASVGARSSASSLSATIPVEIVNAAGQQKCLDDTDDSTHAGTVMTQQSCVANHTPEEWTFTNPVFIGPVDAPVYLIKNAQSHECLDDVAPLAGQPIVQKACDPPSLPQARKLAQEWYVQQLGGGEWFIYSASSTANNDSLVLGVDTQRRSILLNGDPIIQVLVPPGDPLGNTLVWRFRTA
jgi:Ricin-type beta-trefoil lectin domain